MTFQCQICKLHYAEKALADKCYEWCSNHESCNLEVASRSVEAAKSRK